MLFAKWQMSRLVLLPDVVVDVKTTFGRCYLPSGRWNSHIFQVADVIATMGWCVLFCFVLLVADGIAMGLF